MTLTISLEPVLLVIILGLMILALIYAKGRFGEQLEILDRIERTVFTIASDSKRRDEAVLAVAQANNAFLAQRAGGAADVTRQLRQKQAMADAEEAVSVYGYPANDIQEALRAEMDADG